MYDLLISQKKKKQKKTMIEQVNDRTAKEAKRINLQNISRKKCVFVPWFIDEENMHRWCNLVEILLG